MIILKNIRNLVIVIIPSGLEMFRSQHNKDSKNDMKLNNYWLIIYNKYIVIVCNI